MNDSYKTYVSVVGRLLLALMFILSGFGKLGNIEGTAAFVASGGLPAPTALAVAVGALELFGGLALVFGLLVRPAAAVLVFTMVVAIFAVHIGNGLFMSNNGYEFALALLAASVSLAISGAGRASADSLLTTKGA